MQGHHKKKQLLFIDDEPAFLETIRRLFGAWSRELWDIHTAENTGDALALLQEHPIDLVIIDVRMPVVDGLQLLSLLNRKFPNLQKVVLTGFADESYRAACLSNGAELFLEKPRTTEGFATIFSTLKELTRFQPESGFRGVLRRVGLQDVIQMECLSRKSSVLEIKAGGARGQIFLREGSIIHAWYGDLRGQDAFNALLAFEGGQFNLNSWSDPPEETLGGSWEFLVMEAARNRDEAGTPQAEPSAPATPDPWGADSTVSTPVQRTPPASTPASDPSRASGTTALRRRGRQNPVRVEEMIVCSGRADVLYEWKSPNVQSRIELLEFLSKKSLLLAQGLPSGAFDRIEATGAGGRTVVQIQPDRGILLRTTRQSPSATGGG
jgi:DNA-binding NarL/FixJ family response regulator